MRHLSAATITDRLLTALIVAGAILPQASAAQTPANGHAAAQADSVTISPGSGRDDTARIQRAIDRSTGAVRFEAGVYRLSGPLHLTGSRTYIGGGSWDPQYGSVLLQQAPDTPVFIVDGVVSSVTIIGLTFDGAPGANAKGIAGVDPASLLATSTIRDSYFLASLAECIDVAMVLTRIERNQFGVNGGPIGQRHRHIRSAYPSAAQTNANWIVGNLFRSAQGSESVLFESGVQLHIVANDFEGNNADTTLRIRGMFQVIVEGNWFERNHGQAQMIFSNALDTGNYIVRLENNHYNLQGFGATNMCNAGADQGNCFILMFEPRQSTATHVYMGYETATNFSRQAELTANEVTITAPLCLRGYQGTQAGQFNNCQ